MKRYLTEIDTPSRLPSPGELKDRLAFRTRQDLPSPDGGVQPQYTNPFTLWGKVWQLAGGEYQNAMQTGERVTHAFVIRRRDDITCDMEIVLDGAVFRVMRVSALNDGRRFTRIDAKALGAQTADVPSAAMFNRRK